MTILRRDDKHCVVQIEEFNMKPGLDSLQAAIHDGYHIKAATYYGLKVRILVFLEKG
jgi:hypothetical protein